MNTDRSVASEYLRCTRGTSDKVYNITINETNEVSAQLMGSRRPGIVRPGYEVIAEWGRTGSVLKTTHHGTFFTRAEANGVFNDIVHEKLSNKKGYVRVTAAGTKKKTAAARAKEKAKAEDDGLRKITFDL